MVEREELYELHCFRKVDFDYFDCYIEHYVLRSLCVCCLEVQVLIAL